MTWRTWTAGVAILAATVPLGAGERLSMRVSPAVAFAPANLVIQTTVEANDENRSIEIIAESDDFYRSSEVNLDGANAPRTTLFQFRNLPTGSYEVRAILRGQRGKEIAATQRQLNVVDSGSASQ